MKNTILIITVLMLGITACEPFNEPEARFEVSNTVVTPNEEVYFYNYSRYANEYEWSFGDGDMTNSFEPIHYYTDPGYYQVRLSAYNHDRVDDVYMTIEVIEPAEMEITVVEYTDHYVVPNATVKLYPSLNDWDKEINKVAEGYTNAYGKVRFYNLHPGIYYMDIYNRNHNNYLLADDDINFIKTEPAVGGFLVKFDAYVDYVSSSSTPISSRKIIPSFSGRVKSVETVKSEMTKIEKLPKE